MVTSSSIFSSSSTTQTSTSQSADAKSKLAVTGDQFLNILIAQLKHQNPLSPMEGTEFIDSITRLSSVEQDVNQNQNLEKIVALLQGKESQFGNPVSYIDKEVEFDSAQFVLADGVAGFGYTLDEIPDGDVFITIKNAEGEPVYNTNGFKNEGINKVAWDGYDNDGNKLEDGTYSVSVSYPDPENATNFIPVSTFTIGTVTEANFTGDEPVIKVGSIEIPLTAIRAIRSGT